MNRSQRIHWYHAFFLLAFLEVVVILLSLELHRQTFRDVGRLVDEAGNADVRERWFKRAEQCVLELNAPGNDVFRSRNAPRERERLRAAKAKFDALLADGRGFALPVEALNSRVCEMVIDAEKVLVYFEKPSQGPQGATIQREELTRAAESMSHMDANQMLAMREISLLSGRASTNLKNLLDQHEADLQRRGAYERYFIAIFIVLLFAILWFGYRLQKTHQELDAQRLRAETERKERLAAIGELCSSVAHGIRNPLAAIRSSAQLTLQLGSLDDNSRSRLRDILTEGSRLGDRVTGLLNISRADKTGFETLALQDVVRDAVSGLGPECERLGLALALDLDEDTIDVLGDKRRLEHLVIELVSNAMEHSEQGSAIRIRCRRPAANGLARIEVEDQGAGVPDDVAGRIFDLFYTTKPSGTGIGLATVKRIARLHGGDVVVSGVQPHGACFAVSIPTCASPERRGNSHSSDGSA